MCSIAAVYQSPAGIPGGEIARPKLPRFENQPAGIIIGDISNDSIVAVPVFSILVTFFSLPLVKKILLYFFGITIGVVVLFRFVPPNLTPAMLIKLARGSGLPNQPLKREWRDLEAISPEVQKAILAAEDPHFFQHFGFDQESVAMGALSQDLERIGRHKTISQKVASRIFLWEGSTWLHWVSEAYITLIMEFTWSKSRILEVYLNTVPLGEGTVGVEAAANHYFAHHSGELSPEEAVELASRLPYGAEPTHNDPPEAQAKRKNLISGTLKEIPTDNWDELYEAIGEAQVQPLN